MRSGRGHAVREPQHPRVRRRRRPTLSAALKAARAIGRPVKSATIDADGKITLVFGNESAADGTNDNDWDKKLEELARGKH